MKVKLPKHLAELNLSAWRIRALFYIFRGK